PVTASYVSPRRRGARHMKKLIGGFSVVTLGIGVLLGAENAPAASSPGSSRLAAPLGQGSPAAVSQVAASLGAKVAPSPTPGNCAAGMVEVEGEYCPYVEHLCTKWIGDDGMKRDRCAEYKPTGRCIGKPEKKHFCVDKYEYPNQAGVKPVIAVTWDD